MHGLLIAAVSFGEEHGSQDVWASGAAACGRSSCGSQGLEHGLSSCDAWAWLLHGILWDLSGPGTEPGSPVLAGRFFTTKPPRKPSLLIKTTTYSSGVICFFLGSLPSHPIWEPVLHFNPATTTEFTNQYLKIST